MRASSEASGGTLFLDEVGELPPPAQVKLLRALQEGEVEPVGGKRPVQVNVRVISATNRELFADVGSGRFREDCSTASTCFQSRAPAERACRGYPRPHPPLHGRGSPPRRASGCARFRGSAAPARRHSWPGNVRQLENAIFRAVVLAEGEEIGLDEFPQIAAQMMKHQDGAALQHDGANETAAPVRAGRAHGTARTHGAARRSTLRFMLDDAIQAAALETAGLTSAGLVGACIAGAGMAGRHGTGWRAGRCLTAGVKCVRSMTSRRTLVGFALSHYGGQMSEVARRLRIGRSTLYRKLDVIGLTVPQDDREYE